MPCSDSVETIKSHTTSTQSADQEAVWARAFSIRPVSSKITMTGFSNIFQRKSETIHENKNRASMLSQTDMFLCKATILISTWRFRISICSIWRIDRKTVYPNYLRWRLWEDAAFALMINLYICELPMSQANWLPHGAIRTKVIWHSQLKEVTCWAWAGSSMFSDWLEDIEDVIRSGADFFSNEGFLTATKGYWFRSLAAYLVQEYNCVR